MNESTNIDDSGAAFRLSDREQGGVDQSCHTGRRTRTTPRQHTCREICALADGGARQSTSERLRSGTLLAPCTRGRQPAVPATADARPTSGEPSVGGALARAVGDKCERNATPRPRPDPGKVREGPAGE
eukprot:364840-Chlamydomonas_euryale.AAC.7